MQYVGLLILTVVSLSLVSGLSAALYSALPPSLLEIVGRHGRYSGLGTSGLAEAAMTGRKRAASDEALQGRAD